MSTSPVAALGRLRKWTLGLLAVWVASLAFCAVALATTDFYATDVYPNYGEVLIDQYSHYLTLSYAHDLNGGLSCAGAYDYASWECLGAESSHPFNGTHYLQADLLNDSGSAGYFNGHADYWTRRLHSHRY